MALWCCCSHHEIIGEPLHPKCGSDVKIDAIPCPLCIAGGYEKFIIHITKVFGRAEQSSQSDPKRAKESSHLSVGLKGKKGLGLQAVSSLLLSNEAIVMLQKQYQNV